jgi:hypothetical protein
MGRRGWSFGGALGAISGLGLAVRVGYVWVFRRDDVPLANDAAFFGEGADLLARGYGFIQPHVLDIKGVVEQAADHPPLYLLWLAIASLVDPASNTSEVTHMLWSCVLGTATVVLCGLAGRRVGGLRTGLAAAGLAAVYPNLWLHDGQLMSETMAIFAVALVLVAAYAFWDEPTVLRAALLGVGCGVAALSRPELALLAPVLVVPLVLRTALTWRARLGRLVVSAALTAATVAPWVLFNFIRFEEPVLLSTNGWVTMAAANCDSTYYGDRIGYKDWNCAVAAVDAAAAKYPNWADFDQSQRDRRTRPEVVSYVRDHATRALVVAAARVGRVLKVYRVGQELDFDIHLHGQERGAVYAGLVSWYVLAVLAAAGTIVLIRRPGVTAWPLVAAVVTVLVAVALTFGQTRYRSPAEPAVVILSAAALTAWLPRRPSTERAEGVLDRNDAQHLRV